MPDGSSGGPPSRALRDLQLRPRKALGQNFLQDLRVADRIVGALDLSSSDDVLEIGPGTGVLTERLTPACRSVVGVELDQNLYAALRTRFADSSAVRLIHGDALTIDPCAIFQEPYKLIGNIPYYVTGPIVRHYLETTCRPTRLVMMVQREVAERMTAVPGDLSLLGVSVQFYARPEIVLRVPAGAFFPRPRVDSAVVRLTPFATPPALDEVGPFFDVARAGFGTKRKQLVNALGHGLRLDRNTALRLLSTADIDPSRRAETLTIDEWKRLASLFSTACSQEER